MARYHRLGMIVLGAAAALAGPATAQDKIGDGPPPAQIRSLLDCRGLADSAERLACYDGAAAQISDAIAKKDLVAFDRESVRRTKRGLFGLSLPDLGIFGEDDEVVEGPTAGGRIETLPPRVGTGSSGSYTNLSGLWSLGLLVLRTPSPIRVFAPLVLWRKYSTY